jgi:hypothetical protein
LRAGSRLSRKQVSDERRAHPVRVGQRFEAASRFRLAGKINGPSQLSESGLVTKDGDTADIAGKRHDQVVLRGSSALAVMPIDGCCHELIQINGFKTQF